MTVGEMIGLNMEPEDEAVTWERIRTSGLRRRMACLARNLRDAAALEFAYSLGDQCVHTGTRAGFMPLEEWWGSNTRGIPAPGWER